jgi:hypothetical protein
MRNDPTLFPMPPLPAKRCGHPNIRDTQGGIGKNGLCVYCHRARQNREHHRRKYAEVIAALGGRCACCGETNPGFLTIDHIHGGGREERERFGSGTTLLNKMIREGLSPEKYRVLCFNCNCGRARNGGECPHVALYRAEGPQRKRKVA